MPVSAHTARRRPTITCRVRVVLRRAHVDPYGYPTRAALMHVWSALAGTPSGACVVLDIGPARHPDFPLLQMVLAHVDGDLSIEGGDPFALREWRDAATEMNA